jgi:hypothetical protein
MPESPRLVSCISILYLTDITARWLIDTDRDEEGLQVLADLHGGDLDDPKAVAEFQEIKEKVEEEVILLALHAKKTTDFLHYPKRLLGEARSYAVMWRKYKRRVLLAMSSQAFAQLVS